MLGRGPADRPNRLWIRWARATGPTASTWERIRQPSARHPYCRSRWADAVLCESCCLSDANGPEQGQGANKTWSVRCVGRANPRRESSTRVHLRRSRRVAEQTFALATLFIAETAYISSRALGACPPPRRGHLSLVWTRGTIPTRHSRYRSAPGPPLGPFRRLLEDRSATHRWRVHSRLEFPAEAWRGLGARQQGWCHCTRPIPFGRHDSPVLRCAKPGEVARDPQLSVHSPVASRPRTSGTPV